MIVPASIVRPPHATRILVVDGAGEGGTPRIVPASGLAGLFQPGDLLVVNDAATLPASLHGYTPAGDAIELRLAGAPDDRRFTVALLGAGSWRTRTENRPPPPAVATGDAIRVGRLLATVVAVHGTTRLADVELSIAGEPDAPLAAVWAALYEAGRPVQYAHVRDPLALWDVQNVYAGRPWAVEMPSAGRALRAGTLLDLRRRGVELARVTHAAGLSSIGDATADAILPLPERFEVAAGTWDAIASARRRGGRVVAVGTSVARALEGGARAGVATGITDLRLGPETRRAIVDAVLTGVHEEDTTHHALLRAFLPPAVLTRALEHAAREGMLGHELGDQWLVWGEPREKPWTGPRPRGEIMVHALP